MNCALRWLVSSREIKTKRLSVIAEDSSPLFNLPSTPSSRKMYNRREKEPPHPPRPKNMPPPRSTHPPFVHGSSKAVVLDFAREAGNAGDVLGVGGVVTPAEKVARRQAGRCTSRAARHERRVAAPGRSLLSLRRICAASAARAPSYGPCKSHTA